MPNLDIRKYSDTTKPSALIEGLKEIDNNIDTTIETIVKALLRIMYFNNYSMTWRTNHSKIFLIFSSMRLDYIKSKIYTPIIETFFNKN